jgi:Flp pilus assembly protein protease CpaA
VFTVFSLTTIAIFDLITHRIPNLFLLLLLIAVPLSGELSIHIVYGFVICTLAVCAYLFLGLGAGDVKLVSLIAFFLTPKNQIINYWFFVSMIGLVLIAIHFALSRTIKGNIALAPALCGAVLCISWAGAI